MVTSGCLLRDTHGYGLGVPFRVSLASFSVVLHFTSVSRYDHARQIKLAQDDFCAKALAGDWAALVGQKFPEELQWEALVDVLRGRVKVI